MNAREIHPEFWVTIICVFAQWALCTGSADANETDGEPWCSLGQCPWCLRKLVIALIFTLSAPFLCLTQRNKSVLDRSCDFFSSQCDRSHFFTSLFYSFLTVMFLHSRTGPCFSCITMMTRRVGGKILYYRLQQQHPASLAPHTDTVTKTVSLLAFLCHLGTARPAGRRMLHAEMCCWW